MAAPLSADTAPRRRRPHWAFRVTGLVDSGKILRKTGLRPGDPLILTKPSGTGIVLAGHMRGLARVAMAACGHRVDAGDQRLGRADCCWRMGRAPHRRLRLWPGRASDGDAGASACQRCSAGGRSRRCPAHASWRAGIESTLAPENRRLLATRGQAELRCWSIRRPPADCCWRAGGTGGGLPACAAGRRPAAAVSARRDRGSGPRTVSGWRRVTARNSPLRLMHEIRAQHRDVLFEMRHHRLADAKRLHSCLVGPGEQVPVCAAGPAQNAGRMKWGSGKYIRYEPYPSPRPPMR